MKINRAPTLTLLALVVCALSTTAAADTVYMKNGRVITSSSVRVEGDRVFIRLLGGEVGIPASLVERVVEDDAVEQGRIVDPTADANVDPLDLNDPANQDVAGNSADPAGDPAEGDPVVGDPAEQQGDPAATPPPDPPTPPQPAPEETREYWQNRVAPLNDQLGRLDSELAGLRARTGAAVAAQIQRLEARRQTVQDQVDAIRLEARRLGIPPGWLR